MDTDDTIEQYEQDIAAFRKDVQSAREEFNRSLTSGTGSTPDTLKEKITALNRREETLLFSSLPFVRSKVLQSRDPEASLQSLVEKTDTDNGRSIDESNLSSKEKQLCRKLLTLDPPAFPDIPDGHSEDSASVQHALFDEEAYEGSPYLSIRNNSTCFLFLDDGSVILFEHNNGWDCRKEPILKNCFAENAIIESDHSCLILNLDHGIDRISYHRIETADDLYRLPLFD